MHSSEEDLSFGAREIYVQLPWHEQAETSKDQSTGTQEHACAVLSPGNVQRTSTIGPDVRSKLFAGAQL
jgi:hypothetical protein